MSRLAGIAAIAAIGMLAAPAYDDTPRPMPKRKKRPAPIIAKKKAQKAARKTQRKHRK